MNLWRVATSSARGAAADLRLMLSVHSSRSAGCAPAHAVMAPTPAVKDDLEAYGFSNVVLWSRGVDLDVEHAAVLLLRIIFVGKSKTNEQKHK